MKTIRCAGTCGHRVEVAGSLDGSPILSAAFAVLDVAELTRKGWSLDGGVWWCQYCIRRKRLLRSVPLGNVTGGKPPTGTKM